MSREFVDVDRSGAVFREVDPSRSRMSGVVLQGADIDGPIDGPVVNGRLAEIDGFLTEEWEHHRFAMRDLAVIEREAPR